MLGHLPFLISRQVFFLSICVLRLANAIARVGLTPDGAEVRSSSVPQATTSLEVEFQATWWRSLSLRLGSANYLLEVC